MCKGMPAVGTVALLTYSWVTKDLAKVWAWTMSLLPLSGMTLGCSRSQFIDENSTTCLYMVNFSPLSG